MKDVLHVLLVFGGPVILCLLIVCGIKITNKYLDQTRREQHPKYFEYFDAAMAISNNINEFTEQQTASFEYRLKLIYEGLRDGECLFKKLRGCTHKTRESSLTIQTFHISKGKTK